MKSMGRFALFAAGVLFAASSALAQTTGTIPPLAGSEPTLRAVPLAGEIKLDGRLSEAVWERPPVATGFV
jgi:hypothetical protein